MSKPRPSVDWLRARLAYDAADGTLRWIPFDASALGLREREARSLRRYVGREAGSTKRADGYVSINFKVEGVRRSVMAHCVAWALHYGAWPDDEIDHINGVRNDNRMVNLRTATRRQNCAHRHTYRGKSGIPGVHVEGDKFVARARIDGKETELGRFATADAAAAAYATATIAAHGDFAPPFARQFNKSPCGARG